MPTSVTEEPFADVSAVDSSQAAGVYSCPQDGCVRIFQRLSALERHLSLEKCTRALERHSLMDLAKMGYKSRLEQGWGTLPTLDPTIGHQEAHVVLKRGLGSQGSQKSLSIQWQAEIVPTGKIPHWSNDRPKARRRNGCAGNA